MILISIGWFCPYRNRYCPYPDLSHLMASSMFALDNFKVKCFMKTFRKIGCLLLIAAFSFPCFAKKRIVLEGKWYTTPKSIIPKQPIQAWVEDNNKDLLLEFSANLGTVEVIVTNSAGEVVYKQSVEAQPSVVISLEEEVGNEFILSIVKDQNMVYGKLN